MVTVNMTMCRHSSFYLFWLSFSHTYPKYMIGRAVCSGLLLDPLGAHSDMNCGRGGSFTRFSLLEINYFPGGKGSLWKCKIQDKLQVKLSPVAFRLPRCPRCFRQERVLLSDVAAGLAALQSLLPMLTCLAVSLPVPGAPSCIGARSPWSWRGGSMVMGGWRAGKKPFHPSPYSCSLQLWEPFMLGFA